MSDTNRMHWTGQEGIYSSMSMKQRKSAHEKDVFLVTWYVHVLLND